MKTKLSRWQILFYFSLTIVTLWLILKVTGVIQTPLWLEYGLPLGGFILGALSLYQDFLEKIHRIAIDVATLRVEFKHLSVKVGEHDGILQGKTTKV